MTRPFKIPVSVLVVIHRRNGEVLLIERADHPGYWQSVTGSLDRADEPLEQTARREVAEEVGLEVGELTYVGSEHWGLNGPNMLLSVFTAEVLDPQAEPRVDGREIAEARFFPVDALPENRIPDYTITGRVLCSLRDLG